MQTCQLSHFKPCLCSYSSSSLLLYHSYGLLSCTTSQAVTRKNRVAKMETELLPPEASTSQLALSLAPSTLSRPRRPRTVSSKSILTEGEGSEGEDEEGEEGEEGSDGEGNPHRRRKIDIRFIEDKSKRHISFSKRKAGIMKKVGTFISSSFSPDLDGRIGLRTIDIDRHPSFATSRLGNRSGLHLYHVSDGNTVIRTPPMVIVTHRPQLAPLVTARDGKELIQVRRPFHQSRFDLVIEPLTVLSNEYLVPPRQRPHSLRSRGLRFPTLGKRSETVTEET